MEKDNLRGTVGMNSFFELQNVCAFYETKGNIV